MKMTQSITALVIGAAFSALANAADTAPVAQRNVNQEQRIEQGLQSGALNTKEAAKLEHEEARVDRVESKALKDGSVSSAEKARIEKAQNKAGRDIRSQKHDAQTGNPNSASSKRMQADVQREVNQQRRIEQGERSGQLTNREAGRLEHGQAHVANAEARAGADGRVGAHEQRHVRHREDKQSHRIRRQKHDAQARE